MRNKMFYAILRTLAKLENCVKYVITYKTKVETRVPAMKQDAGRKRR